MSKDNGSMSKDNGSVSRLLLILLMVSSGSSFADERDEAIFGDSSSEAIPSEPTTEAAEQKGSPPGKLQAQSLGLSADNLTLGARLDLQLAGRRAKGSNAEKISLQRSNFFDLYADGQFPGQTRSLLRLRFFDNDLSPANGGSAAGNESSPNLAVDEAWVRFNHSGFFYTLGKQHLRWGSGRFWNPTDFLAQETRDPFFDFDQRLGLQMIKVHYPVERLGHNYYLLLSYHDAQVADDMKAALRGEWALGGKSEFALTFMQAKLGQQSLGLDLSSGLGAVDMNAEAAFVMHPSKLLYEGDLNPDAGELPQERELDNKWLFQGLGGIGYTFNYSDNDSMTFGLEYFYNQLGYDKRELAFYALSQQQADFLYLGQQYLGAFLRLPQPLAFNNSTVILSGLHNQSDGTSILRLSNSWSIVQGLNADFYFSHCLGDYGEFCFAVPEKYRLFVETAAAVPGQEALSQLLEPQTINTLGVRLVAEF